MSLSQSHLYSGGVSNECPLGTAGHTSASLRWALPSEHSPGGQLAGERASGQRGPGTDPHGVTEGRAAVASPPPAPRAPPRGPQRPALPFHAVPWLRFRHCIFPSQHLIMN